MFSYIKIREWENILRLPNYRRTTYFLWFWKLSSTSICLIFFTKSKSNNITNSLQQSIVPSLVLENGDLNSQSQGNNLRIVSNLNSPNTNGPANQNPNQLNPLQSSSVQKLILYKTSNSPNPTKVPETNSTNTISSTAALASTCNSAGANNTFLNHLNGKNFNFTPPLVYMSI